LPGGRVIDPSQKLSAVRDIAIAGGRIARIAETFRQIRLGKCSTPRKVVTPGLIDMHPHVYKYGLP